MRLSPTLDVLVRMRWCFSGLFFDSSNEVIYLSMEFLVTGHACFFVGAFVLG